MENIYLLYGKETFLIENAVRNIKKTFEQLIDGINLIKIDNGNIDTLISNIEVATFGFDRKLIIVKNVGLFQKELKTKKTNINIIAENISDYIEKNIEILKEGNTIVFIEEEADSSNTLYKTVEKYGKVYQLEQEKLPQIIERIKKITNRYGISISEYDAQYLTECCGSSLQNITNELKKLIEYCQEKKKIEKQDIDQVAIKQIESVIFDLTDNLGKRNIQAALKVLGDLIYQKEPIQKILITLYNHFKKLYIVKVSIVNGEKIAENLKMKTSYTFLINKYKKQAEYFKQGELIDIMEELANLDYKYKNGLMDLQIGLESILCVYCGQNM